jgi:hypothetical protein
VAAAVVRRWAWFAAAAVAAGFIAVLALQGERPDAGVVDFAAKGLLADWPMAAVTAVTVDAGDVHRSFHRDPQGGWRADDQPAAAAPAERLEAGLKFLHNSAAIRWLTAEEAGPGSLAEFGLATPRLTVTARRAEGESVTVQFGGLNPLGLSRYTRVGGRPGVALLPAFVAQPWEELAGRQ